MRSRIRRQRGQALLMVSISAVLIFGMLGLAVDLGWGYFVKKSARAAADAAAMAAARKAFASLGSKGPYTCGAGLDCQAIAVNCSTLAPSSNLYNGCRYALKNLTTGLSTGQNLMMASGTGSPFNTSTGPVSVQYWVTATSAQIVPQLFSIVLGKTTGVSSARATAAVVAAPVEGSLILLNRRKDLTRFGNTDYYGVNMLVQANDNAGKYALQTTGSIRLASTCDGSSLGAGDCKAGNKAAYAGLNQGGGTVHAPGTTIAGSGWYDLQGSSSWTQTPTNGVAAMDDPMSGKGQPSVPSVPLEIPVPGGVINNVICPGGVCVPARYYAVVNQSCGIGCTKQIATGAPLTVSGNIHFAACAGCDAASNFGTYIFFGGLAGSGGGANVTFDPGMYVFAGAAPGKTGPGALLDTNTNMNLRDYTTSTGPNTVDAGEIFVFTGVDSSGNFRYPGLGGQIPAIVAANASSFQMGTVNLESGNNGTTVNLHGLNPAHPLIRGSSLASFAPAVLWQDQANSTVKYDSNGYVDYKSCGGAHSLDDPCTNTLADNKSPELDIQASPDIHLYGFVYQPRGAWATLQGGGGYAGPMQLITGALNVQGNANIDLLGLATPMTQTVVALIE